MSGDQLPDGSKIMEMVVMSEFADITSLFDFFGVDKIILSKLVSDPI